MREKKLRLGAAAAFAIFVSASSFVTLTNTPLAVDSISGSDPAGQAEMQSTPEEEEQDESETGGDEEEVYLSFEATAYCDFGITYSGVLVQRGIVAADPQILPIGSVIEVVAGDYSGIYTVMDTGGVVKGSIIDIYVPDYEEAIQFGRQDVRVRIIRRGWHPDEIPNFNYTVAG